MDVLTRQVEPSTLAEVIRGEKSDRFLVVDCRTFIDYNNSHIRSSINAFYSKIVRRRILNSKNCAESVLCHLSRNLNKSFVHFQPTLILYGNGCETDKRLSNFRFSTTTTALPNRLSLRRSVSEETSNLLDFNNFIVVLLEKLQNANSFASVLLLRGGFNEFRRKFPELCDSNVALNTPQTPYAPPFTLFNESSCRLDAKCAKLQQPSSTMRTMSTSSSHPSLGNTASYSTMCSNESSSSKVQITQILDFVFLGSQEDAQNTDTLKRHNITKVINLSDNCPKSDLIPNDVHHFLRIPIKDSYEAKIWPHFDQAYDFIEEARCTNQRVLVHCLAGISRSPTLAIAYIMRSQSLTCDEAYKFVKTRRPSVSPNLNFMGQLFLYERRLREQHILPPIVRPRSNVIENFRPAPIKESVHKTALEPRPPLLVTEKLCKSASADLPKFSNEHTTENRKCFINTPLSLPCRPRQLIKNCCVRRNLDEPPQLPSPSTEFSKLDISLANPCFGATASALFEPQTKLQTSADINVENPVFELMENEEKNSKSIKKSGHQLFNLFSRRSDNCKFSNNARLRCKLPKCYSRQSGQKSQLPADDGNRPTGLEKVRFRPQRFGRIPARSSVNIMPTLHDDEADFGMSLGASHSLSTQDSEVHEQSTSVEIVNPNDPELEKNSISSSSSLEIISVQ